MKRSAIRYVFLTALAVVITAGLAASGGTQSSGNTAAGPVTVRKSFSLLNPSFQQMPVPPDVDVNNNEWADIFKKELPDIDINWIIVPPDQLTQRINILVGSGDIPDCLPMNMAQMISWSDMGIIRNINGLYESSYQNIYNFLTEDDLKTTRYNGNQYGIAIPGNRLENPNVLCIRTDWLDKLGLSMPKTIDELYNVLYAFTYKDPDGNGKDDTYGIAGCTNSNISFNHMMQIFGSFGVIYGGGGYNFSKVGNQIIPDIIRPEMRDALAFFARLYKDGLMDKDTFNMTAPQLEDKGTRGIVGLWGFAANGIAARAYPNMQKANPNARVALFIQPPAPDGKLYYPVGRNGGGMRGVSAKCKNVDAVMEFFNWMIGQDMSTLPYYTLNADMVYQKPDHSDAEALDGKYLVEKTQDKLTAQEWADRWRMCYRTHMGTMQVAPDNILLDINATRVKLGIANQFHLDAQLFAQKNGVTNAAAIQGPAYAEYMNDIISYWEETLASIVTGAKPITAWDDFVKFFYANGGQKVIDEATALNS
ncbi:MAG: extracellular solute-binding protein [Treponema sp.]|nr:extracellular solute-binding protein [Treponema sp.]